MLKKFTKGLKAILAVICISATLSAQAKSISVSNFSLSSGYQQWRFTLDLSRKPEYQSFMLSNPRRFVLDIRDARLISAIKRNQYINSPVSQIRWSENAGRLRMVFELEKSVHIQVRATEFSDTGKPQIRINFTGSKNPEDYHLPIAKIDVASPQPVISSESRPEYRRNVVIVIDPGHGGKDPGAIGRGRTREKDVVLAISKKLYNMINSEPGFTAKLTRNSDYYITLRQRLAIARKYHADMFIAIHADKWKNTRAKGASVFALSERGATGEAARWLVSQENKSELMSGATLGDKSQVLKSVLINLSQSAAIRSSLQIGDDLIASLQLITPMHVRHIEQAAFVVLKSPDIPSLLVETGFLSNPREERQLRTSAYQTSLASAINSGLIHYYHQHPPKDSLLSSKGG